jgi:hypothetical protein
MLGEGSFIVEEYLSVILGTLVLRDMGSGGSDFRQGMCSRRSFCIAGGWLAGWLHSEIWERIFI